MKTLKLTLALGLAAFSITACANPDHYRVDSEPVNAKMQLIDGDDVYTYTLPATVDDIDDDMEIIVTKPGYERFEGRLGDLERVSEKSYRVRLKTVR